MNPHTDPSPTQDKFRIHALQSLDQKEDLYASSISLHIIQPSAWLWILATLSALTGLLLWACWGTVMMTVPAQGILLPENSQVISLSGTAAGFVSEIKVSQGQAIKKGDLLAQIDNPLFKESLVYHQKIFDENAAAYTRFANQYEKNKTMLQQQMSNQIQALAIQIKHHQKTAQTLSDLLHSKMTLYKQHYLSRVDLEKAQAEYFSAHDKLSTLNNALSDIPLYFQTQLNTLKTEKSRLTKQMMDSFHALKIKETEIKIGSSIVSSADGTITGIHIIQGSRITPDKTAFTLVTHTLDSPLSVIAFVNHKQGRQLMRGMNARVLPDHLSAYDYGYMTAVVSEVSDYPVSRESAQVILGNTALTDTFFKDGAPYLVKLSLKRCTTQSGYEWTTRHGPAFSITPGSMTTVKIITQQSAPIRLLFKHTK